jgi:hypothetical protein
MMICSSMDLFTKSYKNLSLSSEVPGLKLSNSPLITGLVDVIIFVIFF